MGSFAFGRDAFVIGGFIVVVLLLYLYHRNASSAENNTDTSETLRTSGSIGQIQPYKEQYTDELNKATLFLDGKQVEVNFTHIIGVDVDESYMKITLTYEDGRATRISLGAYDLLVSQGEPVACKIQNISRVRVWAREKTLYDEHLACVEIGEGFLTGYTNNGSDVRLIFGSGLTLCIEEM